jgi:hypothetical protein
MALDHVQNLPVTDSAASSAPLSFDLAVSMTELSFYCGAIDTAESLLSGVIGDQKSAISANLQKLLIIF